MPGITELSSDAVRVWDLDQSLRSGGEEARGCIRRDQEARCLDQMRSRDGTIDAACGRSLGRTTRAAPFVLPCHIATLQQGRSQQLDSHEPICISADIAFGNAKSGSYQR